LNHQAVRPIEPEAAGDGVYAGAGHVPDRVEILRGVGWCRAAVGAGVGDVDRAVVGKGNVVHDDAGEGDAAEGAAAQPVEEAHRPDVRHGEGVTAERESLGRVERRAVPAALDPLELHDVPVGADPAEEAVAVLRGRVAVDVGDDEEVGGGIVDHVLRPREADAGDGNRPPAGRRRGVT
jgi:hypothetical protein